MDEQPVGLVVTGGGHDLPPALVGHLHDPAAEPLDRVELRLRRLLGGDDRCRDAELAGGPRDSLRHVAGADRDDALRRLGRGRAADRIRGAADLEGADRLQVLELEPDLCRRVHLQTDERRADRGAGDRLPCALDLGEADQNSTSVPTPCSFALRTTSSAAARSSTPRPSDLNTVSSSGSVRPG